MLVLLEYPRTPLRILKATERGAARFPGVKLMRGGHLLGGRHTVQYIHKTPVVRKARNPRTKGRIFTLARLELLPLTLWVWVLYFSLGAEDCELECAFPLFRVSPRLKNVQFRLTMANVVHAATEFPTRVRSADLEYGRRVSRGVPGTPTSKMREVRVFQRNSPV